MVRIYFAAPLHDSADRQHNAEVVKILREAGAEVYSPAEHGVWEDWLKKFDNDVVKTRKHFYDQDILAMQRCDMCIAYQYRDKGPSEGQLWEMGWFVGNNKPVWLLNENAHGFNLMPEFGSRCYSNLTELLEYLKEECI